MTDNDDINNIINSIENRPKSVSNEVSIQENNAKISSTSSMKKEKANQGTKSKNNTENHNGNEIFDNMDLPTILLNFRKEMKTGFDEVKSSINGMREELKIGCR